MQNKFPETVKVISLNLDHDEKGAPSDKLKKKVHDKLNEIKLDITNVMSSTSYDDVRDERDIFALPAALVFGADGKLLKKFDGGVSYPDDVIPLIAETLAQ